MAVTEVKEKEVRIATNGYTYIIKDDKKKVVKKVSRPPNHFVGNTTLYELDENIEFHNTKILYDFLRTRLDGVTMDKRGFVKYKGFRMRYQSHGFELVDILNYSEKINLNKYHNDLSCPEEVLTWLNANANRKIMPLTNDYDEKTVIIDQLSQRFKIIGGEKIKIELPQTREDVLTQRFNKMKQRGEHLQKLRVYKYVEQLIKGLMKRKDPISIATAKKIIHRISTREEFNKEVLSIVVKFKKKLVKIKQVNEVVHKQLELVTEKKESDKPERAPKFLGIEVPEYNVCHLVKEEGDNISFQDKGPGGKMLNVKTTGTWLLVCQVLRSYPKSMALLMKVAKGEKFNLYDLDFDVFPKDPYEHFNKQTLLNTPHWKNLKRVCNEILWNYMEPSPLDFKWSTNFKINDTVRVFFPDQHSMCWGKVVSIESGLQVKLDADGITYKILKHQPIWKM